MTHGAIEWIEIPTADLTASTGFYESVFGWKIQRPPGHEQYPMFNDTSGKVGGGFTTSFKPMPEAGMLVYVSVDSIEAILPAIATHGGQTVKPKTLIDPNVGWWASFRDPAGNILGLYERAAQG
jgi:uncharacterized protein